MAGNVEFGITLTADGRAFIGTMRLAEQEVDRFGQKAQVAGTKASQGMGSANDAARALGRTLGQLGVTLSIGVLVNWTKSVIDAAAKLDDMADSTGSTVENLSKLTNIARISGVEQDRLGFAVNKLAAGLNGLEDETGNAAKALATLKVTAKDPAEALIQLAESLDKYADGPNKVAAMMAIFGREGANLLPLMKEIVKYKGIDATVTAEQAAQAEKLQQQWQQLQIEGRGIRDMILNELVPTLVQLIERWRMLINTMGGFKQAFGVAFDVASAGGIENIYKLIDSSGKRITELKASLENWNAFDNLWGDKASVEKELADLERKRKAYIALRDAQVFDTVGVGPGRDAKDYMGRPAGANKQQLNFSLAKNTKDATKELDEFERLLEKVSREAAVAGLELEGAFRTEPITKAERALEELKASDVWTKLSAEEQEYYEGVYQTMILGEKTAARMKAWAEDSADYAEERKKEQDAYIDSLNDAKSQLDEYITSVETEAKTLGMTSDQRELYLAELEAERLFYAGVIPDLDAYIDRLRKASAERASARKAKEAVEEHKQIWQNAYNEISGSLSDALVRAFNEPKKAAQILGSWLKDFFNNMILRPVLQAVVAPVAGNLAGLVAGGNPFGGNGPGSGGGGFNLGSAAGGLGQLFGGGGGLSSWLLSSIDLSTSAGLGFAGFLGGAAAPLTTIGQFMSGGIGAFGGLAGALGAGLGAALPILGVALAIASALGAFDRGGPKSGGSAGPSGFRQMTPNNQDSAFQQVRSSTSSAIQETLARFGITSTVDVGAEGDTDPEGDAGSRARFALYLNGEQVRDTGNIDVGRDEGAVEKRLALEAKRALLFALQSSDLPELVDAFIGNIDVDTATEEVLDDAVRMGAAVNDIAKIIGEDLTKTVDDLWKTMSQSGVEQVGTLRDRLVKLTSEYDGSVEATETLAAATSDYRNALVQQLMIVKQVTIAVRDMFASTRESLETMGLSSDELYAYWSNKANKTLEQIATETDPTRIAALAQQANQYFLNAMNSLPEDQRLLMKNPFLDYINRVDEFVQQRLTEIGAGLRQESEGPFAGVKTALEAAAAKLQSAATTIDTSSTTIDGAVDRFAAAVENLANTPLTVRVLSSEVGPG